MDTMAEENRLSDLYSWRYGRPPTHKSLAFSMTKTVANSMPIQRYHCHPHQKMHWLIPKACSWNGGEKASGLQKVTLVEQNKPLSTSTILSTKNPIVVTPVTDSTPIQRYHCHPHWMLVDWCPRHAQEMVRSCAKIKLPHHLSFSPKIEMQHKCGVVGLCSGKQFKKHCVNITNSVST